MSYYTDNVSTGPGPAPVQEYRTLQNEAPPVTRIQYGIPPAANAPAQSVPESTRVCGGTVRFTNGDVAATETGAARHAVSFDGTAGGSVLATMQRQ